MDTLVQATPEHVLDRETRAALRRINTTAVVDTLAQAGYAARYTLMPNLRSMNPGARLVARAVTVRFLPARPDGVADKPAGERSAEYVAFEQAGPGDVVVMEAMRSTMMSVGGDIKFLRLKQRGVDGLVCDGGIRDMETVKDYGLALWGLGRTAALGTQFGFPYTANDAVSVDGVLVRPGDYLVADDDGVVVIPRSIAPQVARGTIERDDLEEWIRRRLDREHLSPGAYYPPDEETFAQYRAWKAQQG